MKEHKYTSDGKKVVIVGKLNAQETIVQEIFFSGGSEIPSGEHFVVKGLHDAPAESWKAKNLREIEERYEKSKARLESEEKQARKRLELAIAKANEKTKCLMAFANNSEDSQLDLLRSFLAGEITHYAIPSSYQAEIVSIDDTSNFQTENRYGDIRLEAMKLISVYGSSQGNLDYRIHNYSDGSGNSKTIIPCRSYAEAVGILQEYCDAEIVKYKANEFPNRSFSFDMWQKIEGIVIPDEVIRMSKADQSKKLAEKIAKSRESLEKDESILASLTSNQ